MTNGAVESAAVPLVVLRSLGEEKRKSRELWEAPGGSLEGIKASGPRSRTVPNLGCWRNAILFRKSAHRGWSPGRDRTQLPRSFGSLLFSFGAERGRPFFFFFLLMRLHHGRRICLDLFLSCFRFNSFFIRSESVEKTSC
ncbi:hypothetical protein CDAR_93711 [Caerostris darwini]|uniref:Uncharacterized protein n=1 Tax=Caerostris darwini TaxID=1538125 RepID=A0AAV4NM72_9ARAC|nr:hypothetical protein CDAR_93711 [Caerostris darwini]